MSNNVFPSPMPINFQDENLDALARLRVSNPVTLFDSKQLNDNLPTRWDDQEVSGSGTSSVFNTNQASTTISVANLTAGKRVRQTFMRFNYQPGKGQLVLMTGIMGGSIGQGITASLGQFDDDNGIFFRISNGVIEAVIRGKMSGTPVDRAVTQENWNMDKLDGTGDSGVTLDPAKPQIIVFDYEWLGFGRVRMGFIIDGALIYCHQFLNSNTDINTVYMSTPNNPLRYEIENDGTGTASSLVHICCSVMTEGGQEELGILRYVSTGNNHVDANSAGTLYAVLAIRLKSTHLDCIIKEVSMSLLSKTNDDFEWVVVSNPSVAGTFNFNGVNDSCVEVAYGDTTNVVTGGNFITGGFATQQQAATDTLPNAIWLGSNIDKVPGEVFLCVRPLGPNANIVGGFTYRELT